MSYDRRKFIKIIEANGFMFNRQTGDHLIHINDKGRHISVPIKLNKMIAQRLIKENELELDIKATKKKGRGMDNYPIGAKDCPYAPYNEDLTAPQETYVSITISKPVIVETLPDADSNKVEECAKAEIKNDLLYFKNQGYNIDDIAIIL